MRDRRQRRDGVILREPLVDALLGRVAGLLELVVEEVVALLERLHVWRALQAPAAVDVEVRENAEEPRAQVRAGLEGLPGAKRAGVRLLHQILSFLSTGHEPPCDPVDLVGQLQRLFLEANAVASLFGQLSRLRLGSGLAHRGHPTKCRFSARNEDPAFVIPG